MVAFRNVVAGTPLNNFHSYGNQAISFSRGDKGFIALVGDGSSINSNINTGLPSGSYCDVISGNYDNGSCTGKTIHVDGSGNAHINVNGHTDDPMVAIHVGKYFTSF
jgi:alpha-amylase